MTTIRALQALRTVAPCRCRGLSSIKNQKYMPEVNFDETLKEESVYKAYLERKNLDRVKVAKTVLWRKRMIMTGCLTLVFSIYFYTIFRIKQETFLDDFEEPQRVPKEE